jgi:coproporphyrinogen III oxidase-like Fe-S oxidoreductase
MLGLRLERGISADEYRTISGREMQADMPKMRGFIDAGFLLEKNGRICFSDKGFFVSNAILSELLY